MNETNGLLFEYDSDVLRVTAKGRYLLDHMEEAVAKIAGTIEQRPIKAMLVDLRGVPGDIAFMNRYKIGKLTGSHLRIIPIAALARADQLDRERIGVVVARNRGANVEVFSELSAAQQWLAEIPPLDNPPKSG